MKAELDNALPKRRMELARVHPDFANVFLEVMVE
jgi:hypothetical protein